MSAILKCQNRFWVRYFRKFDLPEIDRSVFVYPCYFLFANRHSFNCSVGLPPGHGRQGSLHFYVHVAYEMYHVFGRDPVLCLVGATWHFLRRWKHDLATFIWFSKYFQSVVHQSSSPIERVYFFYFELSLCCKASLLLVTSTELVLRVPTAAVLTCLLTSKAEQLIVTYLLLVPMNSLRYICVCRPSVSITLAYVL